MRSINSGTSLLLLLPLALLLTACGKDYSPDTYSSNAVQQASKVESGVVVGVRKVVISADPTVASATGAAAGGIAGSQVAEGAYSALGALGGAVVGGLAGSETGHKMQDTYGYEYIVRNGKGDLLSVTQKDATPLKIGQRVLLIQGSQARIVNDYTEPVDTDLTASHDKPKSPNAQKPDVSKAADSGPLQIPAPQPQSTTEQLAGAAAAAAVTAITAEGMRDKSNDAAPAATPAAATPAPAGTTIVAQPETPATEPASAAPVATPPVATPPVATPPVHVPPVHVPPVQAPSVPAVTTPAPVSPHPATQPKPAPSTTIVVPVPTQQTKAGTATASPGTAPATGPGASPAKEAAPTKDTAPAEAQKPTEKPAEPDAKAKDAEPDAKEPAADTKTDEPVPAAPAAPAKQDQGASH